MKKKNDGQQDLIPAEPEQTEFFEVETSRPDPQRGFPELWWKGKRPLNGVHYYPAQHKESHGDAVDGWRNQLYWGDNLQVMGHLLRKWRGRIDLVYMDPPFDSGADYLKKIRVRKQAVSNDLTAFKEKQYTDIWTNDEYLQFMHDRILLVRELLSDTGSFFLHCDWRRTHQLRSILDEVFGPQNIVNEIIWSYKSGGRPQSFFARKHDTIYWYRKGKTFCFNAEAVGERRGPLKRNNMKRGVEDDGRVYYSIKVNGKEYRYYEDDLITPTDVWNISHLQQQDPERTGYPTQKPAALLERIIKAASSPGDTVFDPFMGSATTQSVACRLDRRFIGVDINLGAVHTALKRLLVDSTREEAPGIDVLTVNSYDVFRNEAEARALLLEALGVRPLDGSEIWHGETGEGSETRQVRVMPINRIASKADLAPIIRNLDYRQLARRRQEAPKKPVERITLLCMGHEPDIAAELITEIRNSLNDPGCKVDIEVVDILRDKDHIQFKRDSEAKITVKRQRLRIERFFPMNLLQKLSMEKASVSDWRALVDSVLIDFNFDGAVLRPTVTDIPGRGEMVAGEYEIPDGAGTIRVKITDVLSDVFEASVEVNHG